MSAGVIVLNATYEPISRARLARAVTLVLAGRAVIEESVPGRVIKYKAGELPYPRLIRLLQYVKVPLRYGVATWTKAGVLRRDKHKCGYCGKTATTIDHVLPRSRGGLDTWENTVAACTRCNAKKSDRLLKDTGLTLRITPEKVMFVSVGR